MVSFTRVNGSSKLYDEIFVEGKVDTIQKAVDYAIAKHQDKECLGTRQILGNKSFNCTLDINMSLNTDILIN